MGKAFFCFTLTTIKCYMSKHIGPVETFISSRGVYSYHVEVWHDGLHKHRIIKGADQNFVKRQAAAQFSEWTEQWDRKNSLIAVGDHKLSQKQIATQRTEDAKLTLEALGNLLHDALTRNSAINWEAIKDRTDYSVRRPQKKTVPLTPQVKETFREPLATDLDYRPTFTFLDKIIATRREQKIAEVNVRFRRDHANWTQQHQSILNEHTIAINLHKNKVEANEKQYKMSLEQWELERAEHFKKQAALNASVDEQKQLYESGNAQSILNYCDMVLANSPYLPFFPQDHNLEYHSEAGILVLDYSLPPPEVIPSLVEVRYVSTQDTFSEKHLSLPQINKLYDNILYQISLRTLHEIFESDVVGAIKSVVFNGYIRTIDKGTGSEINPCVLSLLVKREELSAINLANIDPKICFKQLKGVGSSKLHGITAVAPVMQISRDDNRFVPSYEVVSDIDASYNLATMDWEDFEHLIRELFGQEFSNNGGEVKVTQASRDGGVDVVAFDPDPIRGGKIVIQAKRYTNTVGVSAVRDLYGTVMNEGATKGILVTTSDFGPDAYQFAKGKPLTLLNGGNLLHLLEKHGHRARINLNEAKEILSARQNSN